MKNIYTLLLIIVASITSYSQVIYIDPGHGYGATVSQNPDGRTSTEIETNLAVGLKLRTLLQNNCSSVIVHMSRTTNINGWSNVSSRALQAQNWNADRLISIHCNADGNPANDASATSTSTGTETYYSTAVKSTANTQSASVHSAYAKTMNAELAAKGSMFKRNSGNPHLRDNLGIFGRSTTACLNEIGFVDNSNDKAKLLSNTWRDKFALGYYTGLKSNLKMKCGSSSVSVPKAFKLTVTPQCNGKTSRIALSWTASANATAYDIYRNGALYASNITKTTYTNTSGVVSGSTYKYYVKAKNGKGAINNSNGTVSVIAKKCTTSRIIEDNEDDIDFKEILTLSFYPNPTNEILNLEINKTNVQDIHYMIMDNNGRIIKEDYLGESRIIDISELASSTYFIRTIVDGEEFVNQIIKK